MIEKQKHNSKQTNDINDFKVQGTFNFRTNLAS